MQQREENKDWNMKGKPLFSVSNEIPHPSDSQPIAVNSFRGAGVEWDN